MQAYYPECLRIVGLEDTGHQMDIKMKAVNIKQVCPTCKNETSTYHGTYVRVAQDLPIFMKNVTLRIISHEYYCTNEDCVQKTFSDDYSGFLGRYSRMTTRLEEFVRILALSTSCEGAAVICKAMGLRISGDTIIRMLKKIADENPASKCSDTIGVDDFAYKKGHTYCTIVCDYETRRPVAVLEGRNGESLRERLKENKHVKRVTRDRASAYAKVISEVLPETMQIADRFHLHQNLLSAVKEALKSELPNKIALPVIIEKDARKTEIELKPSTTITPLDSESSDEGLKKAGETFGP